jgi:hypothetical protein
MSNLSLYQNNILSSAAVVTATELERAPTIPLRSPLVPHDGHRDTRIQIDQPERCAAVPVPGAPRSLDRGGTVGRDDHPTVAAHSHGNPLGSLSRRSERIDLEDLSAPVRGRGADHE